MKQVRGQWVDYHLLWDGDNPRTMILRTQDDVDRLEFLRRKQQPDADWSRDWYRTLEMSDLDLGIKVEKTDVFVARKVTIMDPSHMGGKWSEDPIDYDYFTWTPPRVKAVLRTGKSLPQDILSKINDKTKWSVTEGLIAQAGDLPDMPYEVMEAVREVYNDGYKQALDEILAGDVADIRDRAKRVRQDRAIKIVAAKLRDWASRDHKARKWLMNKSDRFCEKQAMDVEWSPGQIEPDRYDGSS